MRSAMQAASASERPALISPARSRASGTAQAERPSRRESGEALAHGSRLSLRAVAGNRRKKKGAGSRRPSKGLCRPALLVVALADRVGAHSRRRRGRLGLVLHLRFDDLVGRVVGRVLIGSALFSAAASILSALFSVALWLHAPSVSRPAAAVAIRMVFINFPLQKEGRPDLAEAPRMLRKTPGRTKRKPAIRFRRRPISRRVQAARPIAFCRRRWTEEPRPIASRYLATVRRAMSKPFALAASRRAGRRRGSRSGSSAAISALIWLFTASAETASPPSALWMPLVKKYLSSNRPRSQDEIFVRGDPADRRFVHADRLGDRAQGQRPQLRDAVAEEAVLLRDDLGRDLDDRPGALVERLHQPVGALQAFGQPGLRLAGPAGPPAARYNRCG